MLIQKIWYWAPKNVNFDSFSKTLENADRAIIRDATQMSTPPPSSGLSALKQQQKEALLAWQAAIFLAGQSSPNTTKAAFNFASSFLILPIIYVKDITYQATLKLINLPNSSLGFGFILQPAKLTDKTSAIFPKKRVY
ncbi:MAG: hypothetical protein KAH20_01350 [Methylococcales bacterium]|nr:hypothetical protein [Methylococcales bacterium]